MPDITVGAEIRLRYAQVGNGPDVVLIHGLGADRRSWLPVIVDYLSKFFRVTSYDLRGHGDSDMPPSGYTSADMASDLAAILDALGIEKVHLVGHSFGGKVAVHFAVLSPARLHDLTIIDSRLALLQPVPRLKNWNQWPILKPAFEMLGVHLDDDREITYDLFIGWLRDVPSAAKAQDLPGPFKEFLGWSRDAHLVENWERLGSQTTAHRDFDAIAGLTPDKIAGIETRVLAIYGEHSFCLPTLEELKKMIRSCTAVVVPDAGHGVPLRRPILVREQLKRFFDAS